jgi:hypothetical protein
MTTVLEVCEELIAGQSQYSGRLAAIELQLSEQTIAMSALQQAVQLILSAVAGSAVPSGTVLTLTRGVALMAAKRVVKASLGFQLLDNGTALATVSFVDSLGEPTTAPTGSTSASVFTSSDPEVSVTANPDGLTAAVAAVVSPGAPLSQNVTVTAVTTITNSDGSTIGPFTSTDQVNVVSGGPAGTSIAIA